MLCAEWRGTFVAKTALGLAMTQCLNPEGKGGCGVRRVQWTCNMENKASVGLAEKMGFRREAVVRWAQVLPGGKRGVGGEGMPGSGKGGGVGVGEEGREGKGDRKKGWCGGGMGRHTAVLAVCWDDWEDGVREKVRSLIELR